MAASLRSRLQARVGFVARRTDGFLVHLNHVLSSSAGVDAILCTLCYTLVFVHSRLQRTLERRYDRLALKMASKVSESMFPGEMVLATIEPPPFHLSETNASIKALAALIDDVRFFTRLWGLVGVYNMAKDNYVKPPGDAILKILVWGQVAAQAVFQTLENGAYLASKGILRGEGWIQRERRWWVWSNRFWLSHVVLEALRLLRVRQLRYNEDFGAKETPEGTAGDASAEVEEDGAVKVQSEALKKRWKRDFYANAGWFPLTVRWSSENENSSPVSQTMVGLCGMVPGVVALMDAWERPT